MTSPQEILVHVKLPTGEPRGIRIAEIKSRVVQAFLVPRSMLSEFGQLRDWQRCSAIYLLLGSSPGDAKPDVYIGQTTNPWKRLTDHDRDPDKDFWQTAVVLISTNRGFTRDDIAWLEWYCLQRAREVHRFRAVNSNVPMQQDDLPGMFDVFKTLSILLSVLGYPVFEPLADARITKTLYCRGQDANAKGALVEDGFVVRQDSTARPAIADTSVTKLAPIRQELIEGGILVEEEDHLRFTQDYLFSSPSAAAAVVLGYRINGLKAWKDGDGKALEEIKRAAE